MLKSKRNLFSRLVALPAIASLMLALSSCSAIYEDSDCVDSAAVFKFTYDMNLKHADAFDWSVKSVHVLMFDTDGILRYRWRVRKENLLGGNSLAVNVAPGEYDVLTWAGDYHESAVISDGEIGKSRLEDYHCFVNREDGGHINNHIEHFFHSLRHVSMPYAAQSNPHTEVFNLTKDTNSVKIILQQMSGEPVDMSELNISITDENGWLHHDNSLRKDQTLTYHPFHITSGVVPVTEGTRALAREAGYTGVSLGAMTGELTVSRLMADSKARVTVTRKNGDTVFSIPLIDYALLIKGYYNANMSNQEYLDRQDEYNMTFFLDERYKWINSQIIINDWVIVNNEENIGK